MNVEDCLTVRECIWWMDLHVPGYWDLATRKPMSGGNAEQLSNSLKVEWNKFEQMVRRAYCLYKRFPDRHDNGCYIQLINHSFQPILTDSLHHKLVESI